jgi:hypothetical protein
MPSPSGAGATESAIPRSALAMWYWEATCCLIATDVFLTILPHVHL